MNFIKTYEEFAKALGDRESSGRYDIKNAAGYLGCYQFGLVRLTDFGLCRHRDGATGYANSAFEWVPPHSEAEFLSSPVLQDALFKKHVLDLRRRVRQQFESGLVAGAHLLGMGGVKNLLFEGTVGEDGNGTKITEYIAKFSGYEL